MEKAEQIQRVEISPLPDPPGHSTRTLEQVQTTRLFCDGRVRFRRARSRRIGCGSDPHRGKLPPAGWPVRGSGNVGWNRLWALPCSIDPAKRGGGTPTRCICGGTFAERGSGGRLLEDYAGSCPPHRSRSGGAGDQFGPPGRHPTLAPATASDLLPGRPHSRRSDQVYQLRLT